VLSWNAVSGGAHPIDHYRIYRNGVAYASSTSTTYTDANAPGITTPGYGPSPFVAATVYQYTVSAVDSQGNESAQQTQCTAWVYHEGVDAWTSSSNSYNLGVTANSADTSGAPQAGSPTDIMVTVSGGANNWQPFSGQPFLHNMTPTFWAMELGGFHYMTIDLKPTRAGQTWILSLVSRITTGDNYNSAQVTLGGADASFGPPSQVGVWATYKVPFLNPDGSFGDGKSLQLGFGTFIGSISGGTLNVTQNLSGTNVQGSAFLSGAGIVQGSGSSTGTYVGGTNGTNGLAGSYTVTPAQSVPSETITSQRTNMYKFSLTDPAGIAGNVYYVDNIGFTVQ
jgi:hypothetical protein